MKFVFHTNCVSPHQVPLARDIVKSIGEANYRYIYMIPLMEERRNMGWHILSEPWIISETDASQQCQGWLENCDLLMSGLRDIDLFERRAAKGLKSFYVSERWFKPSIGLLRIFVPSYFKMARRIVKLLNESENFYYLPMGIHAARDMVRLCGLMHGDWRCLFRAPKLDFERNPGGRIWVNDESRNTQNTRKYCLDKMKMWGYFVEEGLGVRAQELVDSGKGEDSSEFRVKECGSEGLKVLWVGRLLKLKRVDTIIKAVGECSRSKKITLDIYGLGPEERKLKKLAAKYGDVIKFYPPVAINEVRKLMGEHDVYVLSSNAYEGWGAVVSEALEEGMAVIGTYEAGSSATILPESNLFYAGDWRRLQKLLQNNILKVDIGLWSAKNAADALGAEIRSISAI